MIRVLSFSCHAGFLRVRQQLLEIAGFKVVSVQTKDEAGRLLRTRRFDILLVGHKVPAEERVEIAQLAKSLQKLRIICLYLGSIAQAESADAVLSVDGSAEDLVSTIHRLWERARDQAAGLSRSAG